MPESLTLCGEAFPVKGSGRDEAFEIELSLTAWRHSQVIIWRKKAARYFPFIEKQLAEMNLPDDLKYFAVVLGSLKPEAVYGDGTAGFWRLKAEDAVWFGLRINRNFDERRSFEKSTRAALLRLKFLYGEFGSWAMTMAAYRFGPRVVAKEIEEQQTRDYYELMLDQEYEHLIPRIAAVKLIMENPEVYGYSSQVRAFEPIPQDSVVADLDKPVSIAEIASKLGLVYKDLKEMNPEIISRDFPVGRYEIMVPKGKGALASRLLGR